jgi:membrane protein DedA with SNARE-associated domain
MKLDVFVFYTSVGAGLWAVILTLAGYLLGEHQELLERYLRALTIASVVCAVSLAAGYLFLYRRSLRKSGR